MRRKAFDFPFQNTTPKNLVEVYEALGLNESEGKKTCRTVFLSNGKSNFRL